MANDEGYAKYRCPTCGWWPQDEKVNLVNRSDPVYNESKALEFGGNPLDWTETWKCPHDGTVFTVENSNC